jgi:hypothetical protein
MKFAYEDLSDGQFEQLVVFLCQKLLGISVQGFSEGPDGGRDAKFMGTAELHPSKASPWVGTTIIQAKHTNGYNRHFSETDFFSKNSENTVIGKELPRVKNLRSKKVLDNYMLFANRRLAAKAESDIRAIISKHCDLPEQSIYLCGLEQIENYLKLFPDVATLAELDPIDSPLIVSPDELADIVEALARQKETISICLDKPPVPRLPYERKNQLNNMSVEYAKLQRKKYLKETSQIKTFLAAPENLELQQKYESIVEEFQFKIIAKRKDFQSFDAVMEYLIDLLFSRDPILRQQENKRLTRAVLFYMYWNCDIGIGEENDVTSN